MGNFDGYPGRRGGSVFVYGRRRRVSGGTGEGGQDSEVVE